MEDLSSLAKGSLVMNSSMGAGNTVSVNPPFSPPGSESEATQGIPVHSQPEPDLGPRESDRTRVISAGTRPASNVSWKTVK